MSSVRYFLKCEVIDLDAKESRLGYSDVSKSFCFFHNKPIKKGVTAYNPRCLYFTSDREIKKGDWYFVPNQMMGYAHVSNQEHDENILASLNAVKIEASSDYSIDTPVIPLSFVEEYASKEGIIKNIEIELNGNGKVKVANVNGDNYTPDYDFKYVVINDYGKFNERSKIVSTKILERTPGGFISELEITEETTDKSKERFKTKYYLIHDELQKKTQDFIEKSLIGGLYTIEDLKKAYNAGGHVIRYSDMGFDTKWENFDEYLKSIKK